LHGPIDPVDDHIRRRAEPEERDMTALRFDHAATQAVKRPRVMDLAAEIRRHEVTKKQDILVDHSNWLTSRIAISQRQCSIYVPFRSKLLPERWASCGTELIDAGVSDLGMGAVQPGEFDDLLADQLELLGGAGVGA